MFLDTGGLFIATHTIMGCAGQVETGKPVEECRKQVFMLDSKGLVCKSRLHELQHHKINFAHDAGGMETHVLGLHLRACFTLSQLLVGIHVFVSFALRERFHARAVVLCRLCVTPGRRQVL